MVIIGPLVTPERGLVKKLENVRMKIGQTQMNAGTLYITENFLHWQEIGRPEGISIPWHKVTLHAISSEPIKCIYVMLDSIVYYPSSNGHANRMDEGYENDEDEGTGEEEDPPMTEIWFCPADESRIEEIFNAVKHCQSLHPDIEDSFSEEDDDDFQIADDHAGNHNDNEFNQDEMRNLHIDDDERFADAEEE